MLNGTHFWHMQMHQGESKKECIKDAMSILKDCSFIGLGDWEHDNNQIAKFLNEVKVNDMVLLRWGKALLL
ncbi:hypothetical protein [Helicobacter cetorum]|uniref:hypothetical protein n=1 Tax=Helicobacter cetorum TaxID=138563 RepID=UPI002D76D156|nr:hypothetical protein [Helicobacter cetorum]